jgi:Uncharacterized membrane-anchored protein conserved in bacteria
VVTSSTSTDQTNGLWWANKVPAVTLLFWLIKICATTLGETAGDAVTKDEGLNLGYGLGTAIFLPIFLVLAAAQIASRRLHPFLYWGVVLATTTVGTTISDYLDRTAGFGYAYSSLVEFGLVLLILFAWKQTTGAIQFETITNRTNELFYWSAILVSNTLGTALGDFAADDKGLNLGFRGGAALFGGLLVLVAAAYYFTKIPRVYLFWAAFVLSRPLGATLGDVLTREHEEGGLELGPIWSTVSIAIVMVVLIFVNSRRRAATRNAAGPPS